MPNHYRRCWDCGAINLHSDNIVPEVLCKRCQSQDTRVMKNGLPALWRDPKELVSRLVPLDVARCPECGARLLAEALAHDVATGRPESSGIEICCQKVAMNDLPHDDHSYSQDKWQPVRDAVVKWCDARVDYPER